MVTQGMTDHSMSACQLCGRYGPTKYVTLQYNIGLIVMRRLATLQGAFCQNCLNRSFWKYTLITLVFGWWGVISFFMTPFILINNLWQFRTTRPLTNTQNDPSLSGMSTYPGESALKSPQPATTGFFQTPWVSLINSGLLLMLAGVLTLIFIVQQVTSLEEWLIVIILFGIVLFRVGSLVLKMSKKTT